ncbi:hypothetical protein BHE74_00029502 [Ensete ventricosum]|nr:hypothetical protein GW17_00019578 [Ensete ventricosum]RWW63324.1 hypothetical protein BHE74_00029502 [Ensete ventricosum]RZR85677.1 hypothetical protein BHM03_00012691 [Ensete ventricosum]
MRQARLAHSTDALCYSLSAGAKQPPSCAASAALPRNISSYLPAPLFPAPRRRYTLLLVGAYLPATLFRVKSARQLFLSFKKDILLLGYWRVRLLLLHMRSKVRRHCSHPYAPESDLIAA